MTLWRYPPGAGSGANCCPEKVLEFNVFGRIRNQWDALRVRASIRHLHGPRFVPVDRRGFCVFALVRDVAPYLSEFLAHYRNLGASNIALLDNGSTDETLRMAEREPDVSLFQSDLPFLANESLLRRVFLQTYREGHWVVAVDADEFLDYPGSTNRSMAELLEYLDAGAYNAVTACMIDFMPVAVHDEAHGQPLKRGAGRFFTRLGAIERQSYPGGWLTQGNVVPSNVRSYAGGIRAEVLGTAGILLLKHPMLKIGGQLLPFAHPHSSHNARVADVSLALHHYKFVGRYLDKIRSVAEGPQKDTHWGLENQRYLAFFEAGGGAVFQGHTTSEVECDSALLQAEGLIQGGGFWPPLKP